MEGVGIHTWSSTVNSRVTSAMEERKTVTVLMGCSAATRATTFESNITGGAADRGQRLKWLVETGYSYEQRRPRVFLCS